jgi:hypothetical protein
MLGRRRTPCHDLESATMKIKLAEYRPPDSQRANLAAGVAPLLVLLSFTLLVVRVIEPDTGFAVMIATTIWIFHEMHAYQKAIDGYNARYVADQLVWRPTPALQAMVDDEAVDAPTREFVQRFIDAGRELPPDGARASVDHADGARRG